MKIYLCLHTNTVLCLTHIVYFSHLIGALASSNEGSEFFSGAANSHLDTLSTKTHGNSSVYPSIIVTNCYAFIDNFADAAADYTRCAIKHARPITFCQHCVNDYVTSRAAYGHIMEDGTVDRTNRKCKDLILNSDRIQLVIKTNTFVESLWSQCECHNCFDTHVVNDTKQVTRSNETTTFFQLINATDACFRNYSQGYIEPIGNVTTNTTLVCEKCKYIYQKLNEFYDGLESKTSHKVCMDIVDAMNFTRILWSKDFRCHQRQHDILAVVLISSIFSLLPLVFYAVSKIHGGKTEKKVLQEKRLKNSTSTANENQGEAPTSQDVPSTSGITENQENNS